MKRENDNPYQPADFTVEALPGPWQSRVWGIVILLCLAVVLLLCGGCYGTAIDTRSIKADEVTISQNTTWLTGTTLTISAKGWQSDVRGQASPLAPAPEGRREENALNVRGSNGAGAFPFPPGEPGPGGPEPGKRVTGKLAVGNPGATAPAGNPED
jgi:hypothetical protein